jgi:hypothetical protein
MIYFPSPLEETLTASDEDSGSDDDGSLETTLTATSLLPINENYEYVITFKVV